MILKDEQAWLMDDTITALATPPGEGGIAVIRLSGPESLQIAKSVFVNRKKQSRIQVQKTDILITDIFWMMTRKLLTKCFWFT
jgi:tRNA U34 5-carboxymethylaminomethyl modifying GTPase MnmE/TrmE